MKPDSAKPPAALRAVFACLAQRLPLRSQASASSPRLALLMEPTLVAGGAAGRWQETQKKLDFGLFTLPFRQLADLLAASFDLPDRPTRVRYLLGEAGAALHAPSSLLSILYTWELAPALARRQDVSGRERPRPSFSSHRARAQGWRLAARLQLAEWEHRFEIAMAPNRLLITQARVRYINPKESISVTNNSEQPDPPWLARSETTTPPPPSPST
jgi:hypothetical protein